MDNMEKCKLNSEKIWEEVSWIVKRYGKYRKKRVKTYRQYGSKGGWIVKNEEN